MKDSHWIVLLTTNVGLIENALIFKYNISVCYDSTQLKPAKATKYTTWKAHQDNDTKTNTHANRYLELSAGMLSND